MWYSPYKTTYTFRQITWLLSNIRELREGVWPPNPDGHSSYTDPRIVNKGGEYKAYVENIGTVVGTLERWLLEASIDGAMAYLHFTAGNSYSEIARMFHISKDEAYTRVIRVIKHCVYMGEKMREKSSTPKIGDLQKNPIYATIDNRRAIVPKTEY